MGVIRPPGSGGTAGPTGPQGPTGPAGITGPQGVTGLGSSNLLPLVSGTESGADYATFSEAIGAGAVRMRMSGTVTETADTTLPDDDVTIEMLPETTWVRADWQITVQNQRYFTINGPGTTGLMTIDSGTSQSSIVGATSSIVRWNNISITNSSSVGSAYISNGPSFQLEKIIVNLPNQADAGFSTTGDADVHSYIDNMVIVGSGSTNALSMASNGRAVVTNLRLEGNFATTAATFSRVILDSIIGSAINPTISVQNCSISNAYEISISSSSFNEISSSRIDTLTMSSSDHVTSSTIGSLNYVSGSPNGMIIDSCRINSLNTPWGSAARENIFSNNRYTVSTALTFTGSQNVIMGNVFGFGSGSYTAVTLDASSNNTTFVGNVVASITNNGTGNQVANNPIA